MDSMDLILSKISLVTSNVKLKDYIQEKIISNNGSLGVCTESNFCFKNSLGEYVYININDSNIYVYVSTCDSYEEVSYVNNSDGVFIDYNKNSVNNDYCYKTIKNINEKTVYGLNGVMISHKVNEDNSAFIGNEFAEKLICSNYSKSVEDYIVDDEIVRFEECSHYFKPYLGYKLCFVSNYKDGMFCSGNDSLALTPNFVSFVGDTSDYENKISKIKRKNAQKVKSML